MSVALRTANGILTYSRTRPLRHGGLKRSILLSNDERAWTLPVLDQTTNICFIGVLFQSLFLGFCGTVPYHVSTATNLRLSPPAFIVLLTRCTTSYLQAHLPSYRPTHHLPNKLKLLPHKDIHQLNLHSLSFNSSSFSCSVVDH